MHNTSQHGFLSGVEHTLYLYQSMPTQEKIMLFYLDLWAAQFIVPVDSEDKRPFLIGDKDRQGMYIPVFSAEGEYRRERFDGAETAIFPYLTLRHVIACFPELCGIAINPFGRQTILGREQMGLIDLIAAGADTNQLN